MESILSSCDTRVCLPAMALRNNLRLIFPLKHLEICLITELTTLMTLLVVK